MDAKRLSLSHRLRIYHDQPFPGHIRKTQREDGVIVLEQTYVAYHWLIHNDGSAEKESIQIGDTIEFLYPVEK